jgi:hypothetical protein
MHAHVRRLASASLLACAAAADVTAEGPVAAKAPPAAGAAAPAPTAAETGIAAVWQNHAVKWDALRPIAVELAGAAALQEAILDALIEDRARERAITVTDAQMNAEEATLLALLDKDPDRAQRALEQVRARQGLGPVRWRALLRRNAMLRALVARDVQVLEPQVLATHDAAHGPKRKARIIAVPDLRTAQSVTERLAAGTPFEEIAARESTDVSAARGGLIAPISRLDPSFPVAVREALWAVKEPGGISPPVLVGTGYVLLRWDGDVPGDGVALETVRAETERAVRITQERAQMDQLAQDLVRNAKPTIFDDSLADAWNRAASTPR